MQTLWNHFLVLCQYIPERMSQHGAKMGFCMKKPCKHLNHHQSNVFRTNRLALRILTDHRCF